MNPRVSGHTLVELSFAIAIAGAVLLALGSSHLVLIERAESSFERRRDADGAHACLKDIEQAIRLAEVIQKAGSGILQVSTRHFVDSDDELETVRYWFEDGELRKAMAPDGGSFGPTEVLLTGVQDFRTFALKIVDPFDAAVYDMPLPIGDLLDVDLTQQVVYTVQELGDVDPDLVDAYVSTQEALEIDASSVGRFVTVTPSIPSRNLSFQVDFTPLDAEEYAITYGDVIGGETRSHSIRIYFTPGQIDLQYWDSNVRTQSVVVSYDWTVGAVYTVGFQHVDGFMSFWIDDGSSLQALGRIEVLSIDDKPIQLEARLGGRARFDNLEISYPLIDVFLTVNDPSGVGNLELVGGAVSRQP